MFPALGIQEFLFIFVMGAFVGVVHGAKTRLTVTSKFTEFIEIGILCTLTGGIALTGLVIAANVIDPPRSTLGPSSVVLVIFAGAGLTGFLGTPLAFTLNQLIKSSRLWRQQIKKGEELKKVTPWRKAP